MMQTYYKIVNKKMPDPYHGKEKDLWDRNERKILKSKNKKERIFEYLDKHPDMNLDGLYFEFGSGSQYKYKESTIRNYLYEWQGKFKNDRLKEDIKLMFNVFHNKMKRPHVALSQAEKDAIMRLQLYVFKQDDR